MIYSAAFLFFSKTFSHFLKSFKMIIILRKLFGIFKELMTEKMLTHEVIESDCALRHLNNKKIGTVFYVEFCVEENSTRE